MQLPHKALKNVILDIWVLGHAVKYLNLLIMTFNAVSVWKISFN